MLLLRYLVETHLLNDLLNFVSEWFERFDGTCQKGQ